MSLADPSPAAPAEDDLDIEQILRRVRRACGVAEGKLPVHEPRFGATERRHLEECLANGWVSTAGAAVDRFEAELAAVTGSGAVLATVNGTAALHLAMLLAGVEPGDEVLVPALTFVATANAVRYAGAEPHFVDCDERTLGVDAARLADHLAAVAVERGGAWFHRATGRRLRALVVVHPFGRPADLDPLLALAERYSLEVVEDAAGALGSRYRGRQVGTFGRLGVLSFNGNKIITTGGGGGLLVNDPDLAPAARHLAATAKRPHPWSYVHDRVGYNYRMPALNAALGRAQLERLPGLLAAKAALAARYRQTLGGLPGVEVHVPAPPAEGNHWLALLLLAPRHEDRREALLERAHAEDILLQAAWTPLHRLPMYGDSPRMALPVAESVAARLVALPSSPP